MLDRHPQRQRPAPLLALSTLLLAGLAPVEARAAVRYMAATTTAEGASGLVVVEAEGAAIRVEYQEHGDSEFKNGDVLVTQDGGATLFWIEPRKKRYSDLDPGLLPELGRGESNPVPESSGIESPLLTKLFEEDVPAMLGHPTRHARYLLTFRSRSGVAGGKGAGAMVWNQVVQDVWYTRSVRPAESDFWLRDRFRTGHEELDRLLGAEKSLLDGFPLRVETFHVVSTHELSKGARATLESSHESVSHESFLGGELKKRDLEVSRRATEVVQLESSAPPIDADRFAPPSGFQKVDRGRT